MITYLWYSYVALIGFRGVAFIWLHWHSINFMVCHSMQFSSRQISRRWSCVLLAQSIAQGPHTHWRKKAVTAFGYPVHITGNVLKLLLCCFEMARESYVSNMCPTLSTRLKSIMYKHEYICPHSLSSDFITWYSLEFGQFLWLMRKVGFLSLSILSIPQEKKISSWLAEIWILLQRFHWKSRWIRTFLLFIPPTSAKEGKMLSLGIEVHRNTLYSCTLYNVL